jgi:CRP-like cAMP-binding protein
MRAQDFRRSGRSDFSENEALRETSTSHRYRKGSTILHQEDASDFFYEIVSGSVRCSMMTSEGRRQILRFAGPLDIIGLTNEHSYGFSAEVVRCCMVNRYRSDRIDVVLSSDPELRRRVVGSMRHEIDLLRARTLLLGRRNSASRVATLLLQMDEFAATSRGRFTFTASRAEMADYLYISPETLCRKLGELRLSKLIAMPSARDVLILHREGLERVAART